METSALSFQDNFEGLAKLLSDSEALAAPKPAHSQPSSRGPCGAGPKGIFPGVKVPAPQGRADDNEIWATDEVVDAVEDDVDDGRPAPEFEFVYKQAVQTTDAFLGMDPMGKDPTSTSCEDLLLRVALPGVASVADIDLDLRPESLTLTTKTHKLATYLPHKVDHERSRAQWDDGKSRLTVTMRIIRDE